MRIAARSPAAIAAIRASSDRAPTKPAVLAGLGTGEPVVWIVIGPPRAAGSQLGWEFSHRLFHLIYVGRWKWFRGLGVLFRVPRSNETIGRFAVNERSPGRQAWRGLSKCSPDWATGAGLSLPSGRPDDKLREIRDTRMNAVPSPPGFACAQPRLRLALP